MCACATRYILHICPYNNSTLYTSFASFILDKPLVVTAETMSSKSIGIGVNPPKPQTGRLHYKCNLTTEGSDSVQMLSLNDTKDYSPYSAVKDLSPYTKYTATCLVLKDGVDQCYIGSDTTQTYTDSKL